MNASDPQFVYMTLVLPGMFGLTLVGEGVYKLAQKKLGGWIGIISGVVFIGIVIVGFLLLSGMM